MRQTINPQMQLGEVDISAITFDAKSRDDILRLLRALQLIWINIELRNQVFQVLDTMTTTDQNNGRPGMEFWTRLRRAAEASVMLKRSIWYNHPF